VDFRRSRCCGGASRLATTGTSSRTDHFEDEAIDGCSLQLSSAALFRVIYSCDLKLRFTLLRLKNWGLVITKRGTSKWCFIQGSIPNCRTVCAVFELNSI
jgi:hypothetical protein